MSTLAAYPDLEAFYAADDRRRFSPEADYGVHWTWQPGGERHRVSYCGVTGEIYAFAQDTHKTQVLGVVLPSADPYAEPQRGSALYYADLDVLLDGWSDHCTKPGGLAWLADRLAAAPAPWS